jgi:hypothetical protein
MELGEVATYRSIPPLFRGPNCTHNSCLNGVLLQCASDERAVGGWEATL